MLLARCSQSLCNHAAQHRHQRGQIHRLKARLRAETGGIAAGRMQRVPGVAQSSSLPQHSSKLRNPHYHSLECSQEAFWIPDLLQYHPVRIRAGAHVGIWAIH